MHSQLMSISQHTARHPASFWTVACGEAMRLFVGPGPRCLTVVEGRLWLTTTGTVRNPADDIWLEAGDELLLPPGTVWVIEARGTGRFQLLVPPQKAAWSPWQSWVGALASRLRAPARGGVSAHAHLPR